MDIAVAVLLTVNEFGKAGYYLSSPRRFTTGSATIV
jgi:hypothetical protein